ncbi:NINE protein [Pseudozobellia thermophila]|uniref:NINE protein n=1 Tax=Pseudozobellia thermophila TaxID=192903 RepID=UPI0009331000
MNPGKGDLKSEASKASEDAGEKAKDTADKAHEKFEGAKEKGKEFADDAKKAANDFADSAKKTANEFTEGAKEAFSGSEGENKKLLAGLLALFLGWAGVHKFILGYQKEGIILLLASILGWATACFIIGYFVAMAAWIVGIVEGIIYLTKSDEDFYNTYQVGRKPWF